jgi:hypothetical protein
MSEELSQKSIGNLIGCLLQHSKCMEVRLEYAKAATSQHQKFVLSNAIKKIQVAMNTVFTLFPDEKSIKESKEVLERPDLLDILLITEELFKVPSEDLENIIELIDSYLENKYGKDQM